MEKYSEKIFYEGKEREDSVQKSVEGAIFAANTVYMLQWLGNMCLVFIHTKHIWKYVISVTIYRKILYFLSIKIKESIQTFLVQNQIIYEPCKLE